MDLEGHVGHPPADMPCATLWKGAQLLDHCLIVLAAYVQGTVNTNVQQAWVAAAMASEGLSRGNSSSGKYRYK